MVEVAVAVIARSVHCDKGVQTSSSRSKNEQRPACQLGRQERHVEDLGGSAISRVTA